jgi:hypothetical protein
MSPFSRQASITVFSKDHSPVSGVALSELLLSLLVRSKNHSRQRPVFSQCTKKHYVCVVNFYPSTTYWTILIICYHVLLFLLWTGVAYSKMGTLAFAVVILGLVVGHTLAQCNCVGCSNYLSYYNDQILSNSGSPCPAGTTAGARVRIKSRDTSSVQVCSGRPSRSRTNIFPRPPDHDQLRFHVRHLRSCSVLCGKCHLLRFRKHGLRCWVWNNSLL